VAQGTPRQVSVGRLPVRQKLTRLLKLARGRKRGLVLTHDNPDPDSIASAVALAQILEKRANVSMHVAYGGIIGRAENLAFVRVLKLPVEPVSKIVFDDYDLLALVDTQQNVGNHSLPIHLTADVVIDHHPLREEDQVPVKFADIGTTGATSTLLTQYLRAARIEPGPELSTALYYGIKADTRDLERQTRNPDVDSYLWLFPRIERELLAKIEHPDVPARYFQLYHAAIERAKVFSSAVITDLGEVYTPDMVAEVAERLSFLESAVWSLAFGSYRSQLYLSLRVSDRRMRAGKLIRDLTADLGGSAGGHGSMAGARLPLYGTRKQRVALKREVVRRFKEALGVDKERGVSLLSAGEA
jgi:nanoRNase/pAp phosphatase (c-di-AMP/oligoRNAs hydrolase)